MEVPVKVKNQLETMPQLRATILSTIPIPTYTVEHIEVPVSPLMDTMLLAVNIGQHPVLVMGFLKTILTDTIVDGGSR